MSIHNQSVSDQALLNRRSFLQRASLLGLGSMLLDSCQVLDDVFPTKSSTTPPPPRIACWGDSLTFGKGGTPYPTVLSNELPNYTIKNFGIDGQVSRAIVARQGGIPLTLSVEGNAFNGTGAIKVTKLSTQLLSTVANNLTMTLKGRVNEVPCTLTRTAKGGGEAQVESYSLTPAEASTAAVPADSVFISDDAVAYQSSIQILWLGRNDVPDFDGIVNLIDNCINYLPNPKFYLVLGILMSNLETKGTSGYKQISDFNALLQRRYGSNFVPMTPPTAEELQAVGYTPTAQDQAQLAQDIFPAGVRSDYLHLNSLGYQIIARRIKNKLLAKNWYVQPA